MRLVAIAGGKGGVGKSVLASNLGVYLAQIGKRVLLVDGDPHAFALGALLGVEAAPVGISGTDVSGLSLMATAGLDAADGVLRAMSEWEGDVAIIDLAPSPSLRTRELWRAAQARVLVLTPEPSAVEGAVRFAKAVIADGGADDVRPLVVVTQARAKSDFDLGAALRTTALRVLGLRIEPIGCVEADEAVWLAVRKRRPLVADYPEARASRDIERIARRLLARDAEPPLRRSSAPGGVTPAREAASAPPQGRAEAKPRQLAELGHYELLEVQRGSSDEEIRRACRRVREIYAPGSLVLCGLLDRAQAAAVVRRIEDAYETLIDSERRRAYDSAAFPEGERPIVSFEVRAVEHDGPPGPPRDEPPVDASTLFTGDLLRRIREARGIDLQDIARRTKVGVGYLTAIEHERFGELPARVYVRGFLVDYARCLRLDTAQVARTYLTRLAAGREVQE